MSFDRTALIEACRSHGTVARVVVARLRGSGPREVGASMLVWQNGTLGTIGGGTLEHQATQAARARGEIGSYHLSHHALGPDLGQCCGGAVDLVTEVFDLDHAQALPTDIVLRGGGARPLAATRISAQARNAGTLPQPQLIDGWMVEPVTTPTRHIWVWGAGHVGRALVAVLAPLPATQITWIDTGEERFPDAIPPQVDMLTGGTPADFVRYAPPRTDHLIVTYSHALDLELCHRLLTHGFGTAGLIGSATKWARFRSRLAQLGHSDASIAQITCPIGRPALGKHPQAIALGVGADLLLRHPLQKELENTA